MIQEIVDVAQMRYPVKYFESPSLDCNIVLQSSQFPSSHLIESVLSPITDVDQLDDLGLQPLIEHVGLGQLRLEVRRPGQDQPRHVRLVVGEEESDGGLRHFPDVVVTLLHPQPGEPERRLSSPAVLLGKVHRELVKDVPRVPLQGPEQSPVTVHHNEAKSDKMIRLRGEERWESSDLLSSARSAVRASVWNLLSQRYSEVLMGLNGSKSMLTFFSLPSSVTIVPQ